MAHPYSGVYSTARLQAALDRIAELEATIDTLRRENERLSGYLEQAVETLSFDSTGYHSKWIAEVKAFLAPAVDAATQAEGEKRG